MMREVVFASRSRLACLLQPVLSRIAAVWPAKLLLKTLVFISKMTNPVVLDDRKLVA
jgi:hypothetical protein